MEPNSYVAKHAANLHSRGCRRDYNRAGEALRERTSKRAFRVVLIKPSHYDPDCYVIQWWRSTLPSNSLASVYGLVEECVRARTLGPDVEIEIEACDECNTVVDVAGVIKRIRASGGGMVGLIGVQSNQFPRALDLGRHFRAILRKRAISASCCSPAKPKAAWPKSCATSPPEPPNRSTIILRTFRKW